MCLFFNLLSEVVELGDMCTSRRVVNVLMLTSVHLVIKERHFSIPHNFEDSRKLQGSLQILLTIPYPGFPVFFPRKHFAHLS